MAYKNELLQERLKTLQIKLDAAKAQRSTLEQQNDTLISEKPVDEHDKESLASNMMQVAECRAALNKCQMDAREMVKELKELIKWRTAVGLSADTTTDDPKAILMDVVNEFTKELQMKFTTSRAKVSQLEAQILESAEKVQKLEAKIKQIKQSRE